MLFLTTVRRPYRLFSAYVISQIRPVAMLNANVPR
jgi:hypothetical protein